MSIQSEITQLNTNLDNCYAVCEGLGATMPANKNFDNLQDTIVSLTENIDYIIKSGQLIWANSKIYLQSDGSGCYFNSGFYPNKNTTVEVKAQYISTSSTSQDSKPVFGSRNSGTSGMYCLWVNRSSYNFGAVIGDYDTGWLSDTDANASLFIAKLTPTAFYVNGTKKADINYTGADWTATNPLYLLAEKTGSSNPTHRNVVWKIYSVKIWDGNTLVRHFVPVPQGLVIDSFTCPSNGMFDIASQTFFANQGGGTFTYGKDE